jgi:hypothetical protein
MEHERGTFKVNIQMYRAGEHEFSPSAHRSIIGAFAGNAKTAANLDTHLRMPIN